MPDEWRQLSEADASTWRAALGIRSELNLLLEKARADKALGASLEAKVRRGAGSKVQRGAGSKVRRGAGSKEGASHTAPLRERAGRQRQRGRPPHAAGTPGVGAAAGAGGSQARQQESPPPLL